MLNQANAVATVAVSDLLRARDFYERTLGLEVAGEEGSEVLHFRSGATPLLVYRSEHAGTNRATAVTWFVGNALEGIVASLANRGIVFEHYELPGAVHRGPLHILGDVRAAWFRDPDGNILSIVDH